MHGNVRILEDTLMIPMGRIGTNTWRIILVCSYDCREAHYVIYAALGKVLLEDLVRFPPNSSGVMLDHMMINVTREGWERLGIPLPSKALSRNARL